MPPWVMSFIIIRCFIINLGVTKSYLQFFFKKAINGCGI